MGREGGGKGDNLIKGQGKQIIGSSMNLQSAKRIDPRKVGKRGGGGRRGYKCPLEGQSWQGKRIDFFLYVKKRSNCHMKSQPKFCNNWHWCKIGKLFQVIILNTSFTISHFSSLSNQEVKKSVFLTNIPWKNTLRQEKKRCCQKVSNFVVFWMDTL